VNLTRALALELIASGIRVNCLRTCVSDTPMCDSEANMAEDPQAEWEHLGAVGAGWSLGRAGEGRVVPRAQFEFMVGAALVTVAGARLADGRRRGAVAGRGHSTGGCRLWAVGVAVRQHHRNGSGGRNAILV
jgi:NAD(P)-dependent dehydrogenase (short-subunit alcohol dehydrogenase family)